MGPVGPAARMRLHDHGVRHAYGEGISRAFGAARAAMREDLSHAPRFAVPVTADELRPGPEMVVGSVRGERDRTLGLLGVPVRGQADGTVGLAGLVRGQQDGAPLPTGRSRGTDVDGTFGLATALVHDLDRPTVAAERRRGHARATSAAHRAGVGVLGECRDDAQSREAYSLRGRLAGGAPRLHDALLSVRIGVLDDLGARRDGAARFMGEPDFAAAAGRGQARWRYEALSASDGIFGGGSNARRRRLPAWQLSELRAAERALLAARDPLGSPAVRRRVERQLRDVRRVLAANRAMAEPTATGRPFDYARRSTRASLGALEAVAYGGLFDEVLRVSDVAWLRRVGPRGAMTFDQVLGSRGNFGPTALAAFGAMAGPSARLKTAWHYVDRDGRLSARGETSRAVPEQLMAHLVADEALVGSVDSLSADDERAAAVIAIVMWSHAARARVSAGGRELVRSGRLLVAEVGDVLEAVSEGVVERTEHVLGWIQTQPAWAVRAAHALAPQLTADERLVLRQQRRAVIEAMLSATMATLLGPMIVGSWQWWFCWYGAYNRLTTLYEEIARLCHVHSLDELVPPERRHAR